MTSFINVTRPFRVSLLDSNNILAPLKNIWSHVSTHTHKYNISIISCTSSHACLTPLWFIFILPVALDKMAIYIATFGCWLMHYEDSVWPNNEHKQVIYLDQLNVQRYSWIKRQPWKDQSILDVSVDDASYYRRLKFGDQCVCVCVYNKNPCAWILWHWSSKG